MDEEALHNIWTEEDEFIEDFDSSVKKMPQGEYAAIEKSEQKILNRHINSQATNLIKKAYFQAHS